MDVLRFPDILSTSWALVLWILIYTTLAQQGSAALWTHHNPVCDEMEADATFSGSICTPYYL